MQLAAVLNVTRPLEEGLPVSITEAQAQLRLEGGTDDDHVLRLIRAATGMAETHTHRAIAVQEVEATFTGDAGELSAGAPAVLPRAPHLATLALARGDGAELDDSGYVLRRVGQSTRVVRADSDDGLVVRYLAGYGKREGESDAQDLSVYTCDAPEDVKQAILILVAELYENRTEGVVGTVVGKMPVEAASLLLPYILLD